MDKSTNVINESASTYWKASVDVAEVVHTMQLFVNSLKVHGNIRISRYYVDHFFL